MDVVFEVGGLDRLGEHLAQVGARRVLLLTTPSRRFVDRALRALGDLEKTVFDGARVHVPAATVERALSAVDELQADTLVALGGGAAVGLGKALCLKRELKLLAVPTTYSGSEMTCIHGVTEDGVKRTGRDERARPERVLYDAALSRGLPLPLSLQSLTNAMAQIVSALSTESVPEPDATVGTVGELWQLMSALRADPENLALRERALRAASEAGRVVDVGRMGHQHRLAHLIGGRFDLEHATVHSVLLPQFMAWLRRQRPELLQALDAAAGVDGLEAALHDLLREVGVPVSLNRLGIREDALRALLGDAGDAQSEIAWDAHRGGCPSAGAVLRAP
ncbi:MAG: iron-containing alcohol dehydrogenase [Myxococcales bacterium]|jgi:maleylacetate reductase